MFGALKRGRFRSLASLILVVYVVNVGELRRKRTLAASRGFLAAARLSCFIMESDSWTDARTLKQQQNCTLYCHNYVIPWLGEES